MATVRNIFIFTALLLTLDNLHVVLADCRSDLQSFATAPLKILENTLNGTVVANITTSGELQFDPSTSASKLLDISGGNLVLRTALVFDGKQNAKFCDETRSGDYFRLQCKNATIPYTADVNVIIELTDDHAPQFTVTEIAVKEREPTGFPVVQLESISRDDDCTNSFTSYFIDSSSRPFFNVNMTNKQLVLAQELFYEVNKVFHVNLSVISGILGASSYKTGSTTLTINVIDIDDMNPVFDISQFFLDIPEGQDVSSNWYNATPPILARDGDVGINTTLTYSVESVTPSLRIDIQNETGEVRILEVLDRETVSSYKVVVKAAQADVTYKTATSTLVIRVDDVNDNRPVYTSQTNATIMEDAANGSYVMELTGKDLDEGTNSWFSFDVRSDSIGAFGIEIQPGTNRTYLVVSNSNALRGQTQADIQINLVENQPISGGGSCDFINTCVGRVTVFISDVNDNAPVFKNQGYEFTVPSNISVQYTVGMVEATDADRGDNAKIVFSLTHITGPAECSRLTLDSSTGILTTNQQLPAGIVCFWIVNACDSPANLNLRRCSSVTMSVTVNLSGNVLEMNVTVPENVPIGTAVTQMSSRGLYTTSTDFVIRDYVLYTNVELDRERKDNYLVLIYSGQNASTAVIIIHVDVDDVNDNTPIFTDQSYAFTMSSNVSGLTTVGHVEAADVDRGDNAKVVYNLTSFTGPVECSRLKLNSTTGVLTADQQLPAGVVCSWMVTACDSVSEEASRRCSSVTMSLTVVLSGEVVDVNVTVSENVPVGTAVLVLSIKGLYTTSPDFEMKNDVLYTKVSLDREQRDAYTVPVLLGQNASSPVMIIHVFINDINDNAPVFEHPVYVINLDNDVKINQTVLQVNASDSDIGNNALLSFSLVSGKEYFDIDSRTGHIRLINFPPTSNTVYQLLATDNGQPPLQGISSLRVYNPSHNETASVILPVGKDDLMADREGVAKKLSSILGVTVRIYSIESLGPAPDVGSRVYISATEANGQLISPTELNRLLEEHAMEIYKTFAKSNQASEDKNDEVLSVLEIVLICVAAFLLLLLILVAVLWTRSRQKYKRSLRLFDALNRDTAIYDNPRKPSSSSAAIANSTNSNNAQRMLARLSNGSIGHSSVTNLLPNHGSGDNSVDATPPEGGSSERSQRIPDYESVVESHMTNPLTDDIDYNNDAAPVSSAQTNEDQVTKFGSQDIESLTANLAFVNPLHAAAYDIQHNQRSSLSTETELDIQSEEIWPGDSRLDRHNSDTDSGTNSDKDNQPKNGDETDHSEIADLMTAHSPPANLENPLHDSAATTSYLNSDNTDVNIPPEPEPDYAKKVRFSEATTMDKPETSDSPQDEGGEMSLGKFLSQYGHTASPEIVPANTSTLGDSVEEMTAL